jgi:hypothetical protein
MKEIPLLPVPGGQWRSLFNHLREDQYLKQKYDRERLLAEKWKYISDYCPELLTDGEKDGLIVDIGTGFGVFLECCVALGWKAQGVEPTTGAGGMGDGYVQLARLLHQRQKLPVLYCGWDNYFAALQEGPTLKDVALFNFQGAWAQCHSDWLEGVPHHVNHDVTEQHWMFGPDLDRIIVAELGTMAAHLQPGGEILIVANRTGTEDEWIQYDDMMCRAAEQVHLELVQHDEVWVHKWRLASEFADAKAKPEASSAKPTLETEGFTVTEPEPDEPQEEPSQDDE